MKSNCILFAILLLFVLSCETEAPSKPIDFRAIQKEFSPNTQYKSVSVLPNKQSVVKVDLKNFNRFEEFEYKDEKWINTNNYDAEIQGNVLENDFLFSLNDSLLSFVSFKMDSLNKIGKVQGVKIYSQNYFFEDSSLEIMILVNENMRDKKLLFNY